MAENYVYLDIDKIQTIDEVKSVLHLLVMASSCGNKRIRVPVSIMNTMPILNNIKE